MFVLLSEIKHVSDQTFFPCFLVWVTEMPQWMNWVSVVTLKPLPAPHIGKDCAVTQRRSWPQLRPGRTPLLCLYMHIQTHWTQCCTDIHYIVKWNIILYQFTTTSSQTMTSHIIDQCSDYWCSSRGQRGQLYPPNKMTLLKSIHHGPWVLQTSFHPMPLNVFYSHCVPSFFFIHFKGDWV